MPKKMLGIWHFVHNHGHIDGHFGSHIEYMMFCNNFMLLSIINEILTHENIYFESNLMILAYLEKKL